MFTYNYNIDKHWHAHKGGRGKLFHSSKGNSEVRVPMQRNFEHTALSKNRPVIEAVLELLVHKLADSHPSSC
jgi:hypothetical protein